MLLFLSGIVALQKYLFLSVDIVRNSVEKQQSDAKFKVICPVSAVYESLLDWRVIFLYVWLFIHHNTEC